MTTNIADLVGLTEIADRYGVNKNVASGWTRKPDFPTPEHKLAMGPMWDWLKVQAYLKSEPYVTITNRNRSIAVRVNPGRCLTCGGQTVPNDGSLRVSHAGPTASYTEDCNSCKLEQMSEINLEDA